MTFTKTLDELAKSVPHKKVAVLNGETLTYKDLADLSCKLASGLLSLGVKSGDRVAILLPNTFEFAISYFAILRIGAMVVPLNIISTPAELKILLEDCMPAVLITNSALFRQLHSSLDSNLQVISIENEDRDSQTIYFKDLVEKSEKLSTQSHEIKEDEPFTIQYTSGTCGKPKGVMLNQKSLFANARVVRDEFNTADEDVALCLTPLFFVFSSSVPIVMLSQARVVMMQSLVPAPEEILKLIEKHKVKVVLAALPHIMKLLHVKEVSKYNLKSLKRFHCFGFSVTPDILLAFEEKFGCRLTSAYGLTESAYLAAVDNPLRGERKPFSIGRPYKGVNLKILDEEGHVLPPRKIGEIIIAGPNLMQGYYNLPEETSLVLKGNELYTGDLGYLDEDGYLYFCGRKDEMFRVNALKVYPIEVEEVLYHHPKVRLCAVIGIPDVEKGSVPKAYIVPRDAGLSVEEIMNFCEERLPGYKTPKFVEICESLPLSGNGKICKKLLKEKEALK